MTLKLDADVEVVVQAMPAALNRREQSHAARALLHSAGKATSSTSISTSLSHSGAWLAAGWTAHAAKRYQIGIDIEAIRPMQWLGDDAVLAAVLHPSEIAWLDEGLPQQRNQRGLMSWCRKEALLKAMGIGLRSGFSLAAIGHTPTGALHALPDQLGTAQNWKTHSEWLDADDHQAAVAVAWRCV